MFEVGLLVQAVDSYGRWEPGTIQQMDSSSELLVSWTGFGTSERVSVKYVRIPVVMAGVSDRGKSKIDFISSLQFCYQYDEYHPTHSLRRPQAGSNTGPPVISIHHQRSQLGRVHSTSVPAESVDVGRPRSASSSTPMGQAIPNKKRICTVQ